MLQHIVAAQDMIAVAIVLRLSSTQLLHRDTLQNMTGCQWQRNRNSIGRGGGGGAGVRGREAADYPREASACESQKLGGLKLA